MIVDAAITGLSRQPSATARNKVLPLLGAVVALTLQAPTGASVNTQEWKNVAGSTVTSVDKDGRLTAANLTLTSFSGVLKASAGVVSGGATTSDLPEGSNLYYTDDRARAAITGTSNRITVTLGVVDIAATYVGQTSITTLGTVGTGTWNATAIADGKIASALTGKTYNALTLTAAAVGFTIAGGTTSKTLTVPLDASVSGTNTGDQTTVSGNAGTATALQTARNINGVSFNGTADITVTAAAGTLTGATLNSTVTASSLTSVGSLTTLVVGGTITYSGNQIGTQTDSKFVTDTVDGADSKRIIIGGGGDTTTNRGAAVYVSGNEFSSPGELRLVAGNVAGGAIHLQMRDNQAAALSITESTNSYLSIDTTDGVELMTFGKNATFSAVATFSSTIVGSVNGNAATATALQTARTINTVSFDGTANIVVTAAAGTLTGATLNSGVTASSLTSVGTLTALTVSGTFTVSNTGVNQVQGPLHIGSASSAARAFRIAGITLSGDNQFGALISPAFTSASTTSATVMDLTLTTAASAFTVTSGYTLHIASPSLGAGSAVTTSWAIKIENQAAATTSYAIQTGTGLVDFGGAMTATSLALSARLQMAKGGNIASANNLTLTAANYWVITGATQINLIESSGWTAGSRVILQFAGAPLLKHNQAASGTLKPLFLTPAADYTALANSNVEFIFDGSFWLPVGKLP